MGLASRVLRGVYQTLVPARAKNSLRLRLLFDERDKPPLMIEDFADGPVLVLAPHMDDEVIGCGGALRRHVLAGTGVTVAFLTDGSRGSTEFAEHAAQELAVEDPEALVRARELVDRRKLESQRAAERLGVLGPEGRGELVFLDQPDGALEERPELTAQITALVERLRPRVIYVPSVLDTHEDHWAANLILAACLRSRPASNWSSVVIRQYEVWTPLVVNAVADIAAVVEDKREALQAFESQRPQLDVVRLALALNEYRSIYRAGGGGFAEAFWQSSAQAYHKFMDRATERRMDPCGVAS